MSSTEVMSPHGVLSSTVVMSHTGGDVPSQEVMSPHGGPLPDVSDVLHGRDVSHLR